MLTRVGAYRAGIAIGALVLALVGADFGSAARAATPARSSGAAETFNYERFGTVSIYHGHGRAHQLVMFVSGETGWDAGVELLAQHLADQGAVVAGIDIRRYRERTSAASEACVSPAAEFDNLSHYLQSKLGMKKYTPPMLVGYGSGAQLVYATLAGAPDGLFKGALSVEFCADLQWPKRLCKGPPVMSGRWIVLQGADDAVCPVSAVKQFAAAIPGSQVITLPQVAHDDASDARWLAPLDAAYERLAAIHTVNKTVVLPAVVADLPLILVPASAPGSGQWFGIFLSGDGGWVGLDKGVSLELARHDIPIVGWDSLKYFWSRRTPDGASRDLDRVINHYAHAWGRAHVLLIGFSQGADTLPFMINRLPQATHDLIGFTSLLGISDNALWEIHVASWLGDSPKGIPTAPELAGWSGSPYFCAYGESDVDAACAQLIGHEGTALKFKGGHHFGGNYKKVADEILRRLPTVAPVKAAER